MIGWDSSQGNTFKGNRQAFSAQDYGFGFLWNAELVDTCPDIEWWGSFKLFDSLGKISREPVFMRFIPKFCDKM